MRSDVDVLERPASEDYEAPVISDLEVTSAQIRVAQRRGRARRTATIVAVLGAFSAIVAWPVASLSASEDTIAQTTYSFARLCESVSGPDAEIFRTECDRAVRGEVPVSGRVLGNLAPPPLAPPRVVALPGLGGPALPPGAAVVVVPPGVPVTAPEVAAAAGAARAQAAAGGSPVATATPGVEPSLPLTPAPSGPQTTVPVPPGTLPPETPAPESPVTTAVPPPATTDPADPPPVTEAPIVTSELPFSEPVTTEPLPDTSSETASSEAASSAPEAASSAADAPSEPAPVVVTSTVVVPAPEPVEEPGLLSRLLSALF